MISKTRMFLVAALFAALLLSQVSSVGYSQTTVPAASPAAGSPTPIPPPLVVQAASGTAKHALVLFLDGGHPELYTPENAPNINALAKIGTSFTAAQASFPSDSMSNILGTFTGASFTEQGILYDSYYDRKLGMHIQLDESVSLPAGAKPTDMVLVPTLFQAAKAKGLRTAFISKHPAYSILNGPTAGGQGIDDFQGPEIAEWKGTQSTYDQMTFDILRAQIKSSTPPDLMGLYILAPSGAQKKIGQGITSTATLQAIKLEDDEIGQTVTALQDAGLYNDTVIIITADHGNTATPRNIPEDGAGSIADFLTSNNIAVIEGGHDDLYMTYLKDSSQTQAAVNLLSKAENKEKFGVDRILTEADMKTLGAAPTNRTPDFVVIPTEGIVYSNKAKAAEHGGISLADLNVQMIISGPGIKQGAVVSEPVKVQQIAPTLAQMLGLSLPTASFKPLSAALSGNAQAAASPTTGMMMSSPTAVMGGSNPGLPRTGNADSSLLWLALLALVFSSLGLSVRRKVRASR